MADDQCKRIHEVLYSTQSREELAGRIVELEDENAKLRIIVRNWYPHMVKRVGIDALTQWGCMDVLCELVIEVEDV